MASGDMSTLLTLHRISLEIVAEALIHGWRFGDHSIGLISWEVGFTQGFAEVIEFVHHF